MNIKKKQIAMASLSLSDRLILTGFMGCGKSYFAAQLAILFNVDVFDTDTLIEQKTSLTVKEIFEKSGEGAFRKLESEIAHDIESFKPSIIATGGGFPIFFEAIKSLGVVIYMDIPFDDILARMSDDETNKRPLFQDIPKARALYEERLSIYKERSHFHLDASQGMDEMLMQIKFFLQK